LNPRAGMRPKLPVLLLASEVNGLLGPRYIQDCEMLERVCRAGHHSILPQRGFPHRAIYRSRIWARRGVCFDNQITGS
ncbi:MAG: hypothetical protein QF886_07865, partial [Planctomycetota bacterium]|nr:hypothetical protein [Planctomycetota bacterium]